MSFVSFEYLVLLLAVFPVYYLLPGRARILLILVASYVFYCYWEPYYGYIIGFTTVVDYLAALGIDRSEDPRRRKILLVASLTSNLGMLGFFKYTNFALDTLGPLLGRFGLDTPVLDVMLPAGISFYTFQEMSYTIDVYRRRVRPARDPLLFATYVAFFPQLMAGPISRAEHLLPQLAGRPRCEIPRLCEGVGLLFQGLAKKLVLADRLFPLALARFQDPARFGGLELFLGLLAGPIALYLDFSGYTDMARGSAKLLGIELSRNFVFPFACANPADLWSRWHVTLTQWMRDYVFLPLSGRPLLALVVSAALMGLWHGAAWKFVLWGIGNGLALAVYLLWRIHGPEPARRRQALLVPVLGWLLFAAYTLLLFALFFGPDTATALRYWQRLVTTPWSSLHEPSVRFLAVAILVFLAVQLAGRRSFWQATWQRTPAPFKGLLFALLFYLVLFGAVPGGQRFIYFQF
jgi:alginate O-acetyltransferase complex protein AlgI